MSVRFARTRADHRGEIRDDYLEAIHELQTARVTDLSRLMGVSHVTVVRTLSRLAKQGLVVTARGKPVTLTPLGRKLALQAKDRHAVVIEFLLMLGVPREQAEIDAEGIEHHVSERTLAGIRTLMQNLADLRPPDPPTP